MDNKEDHQSLSSKTPEKSTELATRTTQKRKVARSIKQVRRAAETVRKSNPTSEGRSKPSVRRQIDLLQNGSSSTRSKPSVDKSKKTLPEKFEVLSKFFDSLDSVMRLLRFKGLASNFSNVCPKIEVLTDRRFTHGHLAQLKFILPEAIELKKVTVDNERTCCLEPDLHISFNFGVLDNQDYLQTGDQYMQLRKLFRARLSEFVSSHPEIDDIPKDLLPRPFNCPSQDLFQKTNPIEQPVTSSTNVEEEVRSSHHSEESQDFLIIKSHVLPMSVTGPSKKQEFIVTSHFPPSFSRRFSQKVVNRREMEKTDQATNPCEQSSSDVETESRDTVSTSKLSSSAKLPSNSACPSYLENFASPIRSSTLPLISTPISMTGKVTMRNEDDPSAKAIDTNSTPAKIVSTPARLMASTPSIVPPKRSSMSPDDNSSFSTNKLVRRPPRSRSLKFDTLTKEDEYDDEIDVTRSALSDDILDVLPRSLLQSIREKERKVKEEQMPAITQAKRRQKMIANLPKLFNAIFFLFHKRTIITKEELIYKIIVGNADIVDRREIEEQLDLLIELVPEWIYEKSVSSGDVLVCINKLSSAETVRARIAEAK